MSEPLLEPADVAAQLRLKPDTLYQWKLRGIGPKPLKVGGRLRYRQSDVDAYVANCEQGAPGAA